KSTHEPGGHHPDRVFEPFEPTHQDLDATETRNAYRGYSIRSGARCSGAQAFEITTIPSPLWTPVCIVPETARAAMNPLPPPPAPPPRLSLLLPPPPPPPATRMRPFRPQVMLTAHPPARTSVPPPPALMAWAFPPPLNPPTFPVPAPPTTISKTWPAWTLNV